MACSTQHRHLLQPWVDASSLLLLVASPRSPRLRGRKTAHTAPRCAADCPWALSGCHSTGSAQSGSTQWYTGVSDSSYERAVSKDRAAREGRPSGKFWRSRGKISGCQKTCGRGAKRTQILGMGCSTLRLALRQESPACLENGDFLFALAEGWQ
jgi:hypothetical protein